MGVGFCKAGADMISYGVRGAIGSVSGEGFQVHRVGPSAFTAVEEKMGMSGDESRSPRESAIGGYR